MSDARGRWVWHEVLSTEPAKARTYYEGLFGWTGQAMDMGPAGEYVIFDAGGASVAGLGPAQGGAPSHWLGYVEVGDVDAALERATKLGGEVLVPGTDIPNMGRFGVVKDPTGGVFGAYGSASEDERDWSAPPAPFSVCWSELMTHDVEAAAGFYGELVGWRAEPMGEDVKVLKLGDAMVASLRKMPAEAQGAPSHWLSYVLVPEVEPYQAKAESLGGTVLKGDTEIPGMGRFAIVQDPTGAVSALWKQYVPPQG